MKVKLNFDPFIKSRDISNGWIHTPVVGKVTKFNEENVTKLSEKIAQVTSINQPVFPVIIDSYGGEIYSLLSMIDLLDSVDCPVATICTSKAMSAGSVLLSCGTKGYRYMSPHATLMVHEASSVTAGKVSEIESDTRELERLNKLLLKIISNRSGHDDDYFEHIIHEKKHADWFLVADEALEYGIIDKISVPELQVDVEVKIALV